MVCRVIFQEQLGVKEGVHSIITASVFIVYLCTWPPDFSLHQLPLPVSGRFLSMFSTRKSPQHTPFGTRSNGQGGWVGCMGFCQLPIAHLSHPNLGFCNVHYIDRISAIWALRSWLCSGIGIWDPFQISRIYLKVFSRTHHLETICPPPHKSETRGKREQQSPSRVKAVCLRTARK